MPDEPLAAHSLAEVYLYLMASPCPSCGRGPLKGLDARPIKGSADSHSSTQNEGTALTFDAACDACQAVNPFTFLVPDRKTPPDDRTAAVVNPTDEPSRILDVGQWIMLFRVITEAAGKEKDKIQARHLGIEAAQCLEEALKFYDEPGNDLPPPEALFTEASRDRFRHTPKHFSRRRLIELRAKLPTMAAMRASLTKRKKKPWWKRGG